MAITIQVKGLRELGEAFGELDADIQGKIARSATNAMAQVVKKIARAKAPVAKADYVVHPGKGEEPVKVPKGNVRDNIIVKRLKPSRTELTSEHIVTVRSKKKYGYASRIGSFNEFGTVKTAVHAFMRPALDEGKEAAIAACKKKLAARIEKAGKK